MHGLLRVGFDRKAQTGSEFDGPQDTNWVFPESNFWIAYGSNRSRFQIFPTTYIVDYLSFDGVVKESVDGQISTAGVIFYISIDIVVSDQQISGKSS
jgi:hypothetical protein